MHLLRSTISAIMEEESVSSESNRDADFKVCIDFDNTACWK